MTPRTARIAAHPLRATAALALILGATLTLGTVHAADAPTGPAVTVDIKRFAFAPRDVTIAPGTTIVWTNRDDAPHTVTGKDKTFASKGLDTGDRYDHTFDTEGDFAYICGVHPFMTGVVHVRKP